MISESVQFTLINEEATSQFAAVLARSLFAPATIYLHGNLGAGKTFFTRAFISSLGFSGRVKSPTFTLMESYQLTPPVYHFDFYRFTKGSDWRDAGFEEYLPGDGIALVEWPENAVGLPPPDIDLHLAQWNSENSRVATVHAYTSKAMSVVHALQSRFGGAH